MGCSFLGLDEKPDLGIKRHGAVVVDAYSGVLLIPAALLRVETDAGLFAHCIP